MNGFDQNETQQINDMNGLPKISAPADATNFAVLSEHNDNLQITNTVTILSEPVLKKADSEDEGRLQIRWSESSGQDSDGDDQAEIKEDSEVREVKVASASDSDVKFLAGRQSQTAARQSIEGEFKFSFAANITDKQLQRSQPRLNSH